MNSKFWELQAELDKRENLSKCSIAITQNNYKKGGTVCKLCYNNHVLAHYKNKFCSNTSPKSDVSTQTDFSDKEDGLNKRDSSNKQDRSNKQSRSSEQDISSKQDTSTNYLINVDLNILCERLQENWAKNLKSEKVIKC